MIVDQSPDGLEVLRGSSTYVFDGNWKLQTENGADGYHVSATHWNYARHHQPAQGIARRRQDPRHGCGRLGQARRRLLLVRAWPPAALDHLGQPRGPAELDRRGELAEQHGQAMADWMINRSRNLCLYPNVYLMDQFSSQIRTYRPIAVDKTEVTIYCIAPAGRGAGGPDPADPPVRGFLQRQRHGDPGRPGRIPRLPDRLSRPRGAVERPLPRRPALDRGADEGARAIGLKPLLSGAKTEDEGLFAIQHRYWMDTMRRHLP